VTRQETERALLEFADFVHQTTVYVIGSQAIYGAYPDFELGIVLASKDIDVFTLPYLERWWLPVNERFGSDSDFGSEWNGRGGDDGHGRGVEWNNTGDAVGAGNAVTEVRRCSG